MPMGAMSTRLPRRAVDPRERAPITVDEGAGRVGSAVIISGEAEQAAVLRRHLRLIASWPPQEADLLESLASELFNNAITHSRSGDPGGEVTVTVITFPGRVQVKVTDQGPRKEQDTTPHLRPLDLTEVGGLGLRMVAAQASRWGALHEGGRTTVWFDLDRADARR